MDSFSTILDGHEYQQPGYEIRDCTECGLLFKSATMGQADMSDYYDHVDYHKWETPGLYPTERIALDFLSKLPRGSRILDYGCSSGRLLSPLVTSHQCLGSELNAAAAQRAAQAGLTMIPPEEFHRAPPRGLDAVVLMDVFEHLTSPSQLLRSLLDCLKQGGLLLIGTGNGDAPACKRDPAKFWYFRNVEHICMMTHRHAVYLSDTLGARLDSWIECSHYETPLLERVAQLAKNLAYWQIQCASPVWRSILTLIPVIKRAKHWPCAPALTCTPDHVVIAFSKSTD